MVMMHVPMPPEGASKEALDAEGWRYLSHQSEGVCYASYYTWPKPRVCVVHRPTCTDETWRSVTASVFPKEWMEGPFFAGRRWAYKDTLVPLVGCSVCNPYGEAV